MSKYSTLSDLNAFLEEKGKVEEVKVKNKEEYIEREPKSIVDMEAIGTKKSKKEKALHYSTEDFAIMLNEVAKSRGISYAEVCMEVFEKGSEFTPVLKGGGVVTTWVAAHKTAINVFMNSLKNR